MIDIRDKNGNIRYSVEVSERSVYHKELMADEYVLLTFESDVLVHLCKGDYIDTAFGRFEIVAVDKPERNVQSDGGWTYEQKFCPPWARWANRLMFYSRQKGSEKAWKMTQRPEYFMQILVDNLREAGLGEWTYAVDAGLTEMKLVEFDGTSLLDALTKIAETWQTEWWITDNVIHLSKCEYGSPVVLEDGDVINGMEREDSQDTGYITRLYAFGSTRNVPQNYRKNEEDSLVIEGVVERRLKLPAGIDHIDAWDDMKPEDVVEGIVVMDDVYPHRVGTMTGITTKQYVDKVEQEDGSTEEVKWNAYRFKDADLKFSKDYVIPGEELRIIFQTGTLAGMDFAVTFNPDGVAESKVEAQLWEIVRNEDYGIALPNDNFKPSDGDTYILYGYNPTFVSDWLIPRAEQELLEKAREVIKEKSEDKSVYNCTTNPVRCAGYKEDGGALVYHPADVVDLDVGQAVELRNEGYFGTGSRLSRIRSFEKRMDNRFRCTYTVGQSAAYSGRAALEEKVDAIAYKNAQFVAAGGSAIYVIKRYDGTAPSDHNVYSAARSDRQFLRRDVADTAYGQITHKQKSIHEQGAQFGEQFIGGLLGRGGSIDGGGNGELRSLKLWEWLEVPELRYNKVSIYTGIRWDTFGGGIIESITPDGDGSATGHGVLKLEEGEYGAIEVGDLCMGIWHDTTGNAEDTTDDHRGNFTFAGFKTVYFEITAVSGANNSSFAYILRSSSDGGNGIHPFAKMHFAARGNITDTERQAFTYTTTEYSLSLVGVSTWNFQPNNYSAIHGNIEGFSMPAVNAQGQEYTKVFHGHGQVFGNAYIFGKIDAFERVAYRCFISQSMGGSIAPNEEEEVTVTIFNGYGEDVTAKFTLFSVTRNTGDEASDALWNSRHTNVGNPFTIAFSDLGIDGNRKTVATFFVTASDEGTGDVAKAATATYFI